MGAEVAACAGSPWGMAPVIMQAVEANEIGSLTEALEYEDDEGDMSETDAAFRSMVEEKYVTKKMAAIQEIKREIHECFKLDEMRISYKQKYHAMEQIDEAHVQALRALVESGEKAVQTKRKASYYVRSTLVGMLLDWIVGYWNVSVRSLKSLPGSWCIDQRT
jgi:hypothetical protein